MDALISDCFRLGKHMTTHELARTLMKLQDVPVVCFSNDYDAPVLSLEFAEERYLKKVNDGIQDVWIASADDTVKVVHLY